VQRSKLTRQLYFRKKSSDEAVMKQIFVDQQYNWTASGDARLMSFSKRQDEKGLRPLVGCHVTGAGSVTPTPRRHWQPALTSL
jgi:hypothetical protein